MIVFIYLLAFFVFWTASMIVEHILKKRNGNINDNKQPTSKRSRPGKKSIL